MTVPVLRVRRELPALIAVALLSAFFGVRAEATVLALVAESAGVKRLATIDPATAAITPFGPSLAIGGFSTGTSSLVDGDGVVYFTANAAGETARRIYSVDSATGTLLGNPLLTGAGIGTTPAFLHAVGADLVALLDVSASEKRLARIDPTTGAVGTTGPALPLSGYAGGVSAYDAAAGRIFFAATPVGSSVRRLYVADAASLEITSSADVSVPAGYLAEPTSLAWSSRTGVLYTILRASAAAGVDRLATLDPATGAATTVGAGHDLAGWSSGVAALDPDGGRLYAAITNRGDSTWRLATIDVASGTFIAASAFSIGVGDPFPIFLEVRDAGAGIAGRVPDGFLPGTPVMATKSGSGVLLEWSASCGGATDYEIYSGATPVSSAMTALGCSTGGPAVLSATVLPPTSDRFLLVVPRRGTIEGSYGVDSAGAERSRSSAPCSGTTHDTTACP